MKKVLITSLLLGNIFFVKAQSVSINTDGSTADGSAILDVKSTSKGLLVPRVTLVQRNAIPTPAIGLYICQTDNTPGFYYNSGTPSTPSWIQLIPANSSGLVSTDRLGTGTANNTTFLRGDGTWAAASGLPSQTGNGGSVLNTNGTTASWSNPLPNMNVTFRIIQGNAAYTINPFSNAFNAPDLSNNINSLGTFIMPISNFTVTFSSYRNEAMVYELFEVTPVASSNTYPVIIGTVLATATTTAYTSGAPTTAAFTYNSTAQKLLTIRSRRPDNGTVMVDGGVVASIRYN